MKRNPCSVRVVSRYSELLFALGNSLVCVYIFLYVYCGTFLDACRVAENLVVYLSFNVFSCIICQEWRFVRAYVCVCVSVC